MEIWYRQLPCAICGEPLREFAKATGLELIDFPGVEFLQICDGVVHKECLGKATWEQRAKFVAAWNRACSWNLGGDLYRVESDGRIGYTEIAWQRLFSPEAKQRQAEAQALRDEEWRRRLKELDGRVKAARRKAIESGMATANKVDEVIREMGVEQFRREFAEFRVSRAFFRV
jgi:hypothetical protein